MKYLLLTLLSALGLIATPAWAFPQSQNRMRGEPRPSWSDVPPVKLEGDLEIFWNVTGGSRQANDREAVAREDSNL